MTCNRCGEILWLRDTVNGKQQQIWFFAVLSVQKVISEKHGSVTPQ